MPDGASAAQVAVGAAAEVGEHRERTREGERLVRTRRDGQRVFLELVDEARYVHQLVRKRARVLEVQEVIIRIGHIMPISY